MYVRCVANSNWKLWTTEKRQHRFGITGNVACVPIHAFALHSNTLFFFSVVLHENWRIFPRSFEICCNIRRPYKISNILYKTNEKAVSFFIDNIWNITWPFPSAFIFPAAWHALFGNIETCVVVFFSGATLVQWSDVEHALCAFSGVCWDYFQVFRRFGCAKWKYCEKWHLPAEDLKPVFYT